MTTLKEFDKMLSHHDWYYAFCDDYSAYMRGQRSADALGAIVRESEDHARLFKAWRDLHFTGPNWVPPSEPFTKEQLDAVRTELGVI